jgi:hypothetical protein
MHGVLASRTARVFGFAPLGHNSYAFQIFSAGVSVLNLAGRPRACVRKGMYSARESCLPLCLPREQEKAKEIYHTMLYPLELLYHFKCLHKNRSQQ